MRPNAFERAARRLIPALALVLVWAAPHAAGASPTQRAEDAILAELIARAAGPGIDRIARPAASFGLEGPRFLPYAFRPAPLTPPERREFERLAETAAQAQGLDTGFFKRLIRQESGYNPDAISRAGAQGIAQFMPGTAAIVGLDDPFDPAKALPKSAEFLARLHRRLGNEGLAAAAYNAGESRVRAWLAGRGTLALETQLYVRAITGRDVSDWSSPGTAAEAENGSMRVGTSAASARPFGMSRFQSAEWLLGASLLGRQSALANLLTTAGRPSKGALPGASVGRRAASAQGERALCEAMRRTGCIVAVVY